MELKGTKTEKNLCGLLTYLSFQYKFAFLEFTRPDFLVKSILHSHLIQLSMSHSVHAFLFNQIQLVIPILTPFILS